MARANLKLVTPKEQPVVSLYEDDPKWLKHARIPNHYWQAEVREDLSPSCAKFLKNLQPNLKKGFGLYLRGGNGTGKTTLACGLLRVALKHTRRVLFITSYDLIDAYIHNRMYDDEMTLGKAAETRTLLVVDDLGSEYRGAGSGFSEQKLTNLLRTRLSNKRSTIITSNMGPEVIEKIYRESMASLVSEACIPVKIEGEDRRREKWKQMAKEAFE